VDGTMFFFKYFADDKVQHSKVRPFGPSAMPPAEEERGCGVVVANGGGANASALLPATRRARKEMRELEGLRCRCCRPTACLEVCGGRRGCLA
jgi:hypothetical protein